MVVSEDVGGHGENEGGGEIEQGGGLGGVKCMQWREWSDMSAGGMVSSDWGGGCRRTGGGVRLRGPSSQLAVSLSKPLSTTVMG